MRLDSRNTATSFVIRVDNINTLMSLACFQSFSCVFNTSVRVSFLFSFFCVVGSPLSRVSRGQFWSQFWVSPLSRQVLNLCVINVDSCFALLLVCADQLHNSS